MRKPTGLYPRVHVVAGASAAVGQAGGVVLVETIRTSRLDCELSSALAPWRRQSFCVGDATHLGFPDIPIAAIISPQLFLQGIEGHEFRALRRRTQHIMVFLFPIACVSGRALFGWPDALLFSYP